MNIKSVSLLLSVLIANFTDAQSAENKKDSPMAAGKKVLSAAVKKQYQISLKEQSLRFAQSISKRYKPDAYSYFATPPESYFCVSNKKEFLAELQQLQSK